MVVQELHQEQPLMVEQQGQFLITLLAHQVQEGLMPLVTGELILPVQRQH